jgi:hypothetical protein
VCNGVYDLILSIHAPKEHVLPKSGRIFSKNYAIDEDVCVSGLVDANYVNYVFNNAFR